MGKKMHVGFPEKALERYAISLVSKGFKVAVVEQTETPKQMEERLKSSNRKSGAIKEEKTIKRELVEVMTKGTYSSINDPEPKYLLSLRVGFDNQIGICILESTTNYITIGNIKDDEHLTKFKTLICQIRPNEIVFDPENIPSVILKILTNGYFPPVQSPLPNKQNKWHSGVAYNHLEKLYGEYNKGKWPENLKWFFEEREARDVVFSALGGLFSYLEQVLILDKSINSARYSKYDPKIGLNKALILDSQALQHLEILESNTTFTNATSSFDGSLLSFIDKTMSFGGKRMLKRWLCAPLLSVERINDRLNAIEDLQKYGFLRDSFRKEINNLPDLERLCAKFYQYSIKQTTNAIYFEDVSSIRLREFHSLLKQLLKAESLITGFQDQSKNFASKRLKNLVNYNKKDSQLANKNNNDIYYEDADYSEEEGILPRINEIVNYISSLIEWQGKDKNEPAPQRGILDTYDEQMDDIESIKKELQDYLISIRKRFGDHSIDYCHVKYRYELEIPEKHVKGTKKPEDLEFTSARVSIIFHFFILFNIFNIEWLSTF
jgi:DNA mismatch repair protein MSH6